MESQQCQKQALLDLSLPAMVDWLRDHGEAPFRARQLYHWLYQELASDFDAMANLPKPLREKLKANASIASVNLVANSFSSDRLTRKALLRLSGNTAVESVLMIYPPTEESRSRRTVCVSSQAGCAVGCAFCATGRLGLTRNLTVGEIVAQVLYFARHLRSMYGPQDAVTNVVFMGQGEPMANFSAVWAAIELLNSPFGFGLGARHITVSTVGIVPGILEMAGKGLQVGLAISLHAADDELRSRLVPMNKRYPIAALMGACRDYIARTNRRVTFEYALIRGVNDSVAQAEQVASLLSGLLCHVNLIPLNAVAGSAFQAPAPSTVVDFQSVLQRRGVIATVRAERGSHIDGACGQLHAGRALA